MLDMSTIFASLVFGSIGFGYFIYGKKQSNVAIKYTGIALILFPYMVPGTAALIAVGIGLMFVPLLLNKIL